MYISEKTAVSGAFLGMFEYAYFGTSCLFHDLKNHCDLNAADVPHPSKCQTWSQHSVFAGFPTAGDSHLICICISIYI